MKQLKCAVCDNIFECGDYETAAICPQCGATLRRKVSPQQQTTTDHNENNLICKSCGGKLVKDSNILICVECGEAYKNEDVAKIGNVVTRTKTKRATESFSAEKTERLNNLYNIARRAKDSDNSEQAEKYYDMILIEDPDSWEAVFYTTYFNVVQSKIGQIASSADKLKGCLNSVFALIEEYVPSDEEGGAISEVYVKTKNLAELLFSSAQSHYSKFSDTNGASSEFWTRCESIYELLCELGDQLEKRFGGNPAVGGMCTYAWKKGIEIRLNYRYVNDTAKQTILSYVDKIKKYDPSYSGVTFNNGGCYVATCVYGSYDCPEVWTLRRFRDYTLDETWYGRMFIKTYYAISPKLVEKFGHTPWFKRMWKNRLDKMVEALNHKGYENTKYFDKY